METDQDRDVSEETAFSEAFLDLLLRETESAQKRSKYKSDVHNIQPFSLTAAVLSENIVASLPGVIGITLHNFTTSFKVKYRKVNKQHILLGSVKRINEAGCKLSEMANEHNKSKNSDKKQIKAEPKKTLKPKEAIPEAPCGRRTSSRLSHKPRKSYQNLHIFGQTDPGVLIKEEQDSDLDLDDSEAYEPSQSAVKSKSCEEKIKSGGKRLSAGSTSGDQDKINDDAYDDINSDENVDNTENILPKESQSVVVVDDDDDDDARHIDGSSVDYDQADDNGEKTDITHVSVDKQDKLPPRKIIGKKPKKEKTDPERCDICFLKFPSAMVLGYHRKKHFTIQGDLTETALALHIQGLIKHNIQENLFGELADQVQIYRKSIDPNTSQIQGIDNTDNSLLLTELRVEGVTSSDKTGTSKDDNSDYFSTAALGLLTESSTRKRGRKPNFDKGIPFTIKGKSVTGTEIDKRVVPGEDGSAEGGLECALCQTKLISKQSLAIHMKNIHGDRKKELKRRRQRQQEELKCPKCDFVCYRTQNFTRHLKTHNNPDLYMCDKCNYTHKLRAEVLRHKRNAHAEKTFPCEYCGSMHRNKSLLNMHVKLKHTLEYSIVCDDCGKVCKTKHAYREHKAKHESGELDGPPGQIMCNLCARVLPSRNSFEQHKLKFHGDDLETEETRKMNEGVVILLNGTFQCKYCSVYMNNNAREVRRHILRKHMARKYQCDQCKAAFPLEKLLVKHIRIVHYGLEKKKCPECNKWFRNNTYLNQHVKRVHTLEYQCHLCKKHLSDKRSLLDHCELHKPPHERTYRFSCDICNKKFRFRSNLDYHMLEHTGQKCFSCSECGLSFRTKQILERHMTTHTDERPFVCDHCPKAFKLGKYLEAHMLTHSVNQHICSLCWKPFGSKDAMLRHTCKSFIVKTEASLLADGVQHDSSELAPTDDRIIKGELLVDTEQNGTMHKEMVHYYTCAACREGFIDIEEATDHVCSDDTGVLAMETEPISENDVSNNIIDTIVTESDAIQSLLVQASQATIIAPTSLLEGTTIDTTSLLQGEEFVLMEQAVGQTEEGEMKTMPQEGEDPMEMYMCGICNSLYSCHDAIQLHLQEHVNEFDNETHADEDLMSTSKSHGGDTEADNEHVAMETDAVAMESDDRNIGTLSLVLQKMNEQAQHMLKSDDLIHYTT